jgi:hypothetical protein
MAEMHVAPNVGHERHDADGEAGCGMSARWTG